MPTWRTTMCRVPLTSCGATLRLRWVTSPPDIQGSVVYRGDNNYDLSAFFSAVKGRHGDLLKKATASAHSWNNDTAKQQVEELKTERAKAMLAQDGENWAINALVHNNDWATMSKADFRAGGGGLQAVPRSVHMQQRCL